MNDAHRQLKKLSLAHWLGAGARPVAQWASEGQTKVPLRFVPDLDSIKALAPEREALWSRLEKTSFLTSNEKRAAIGYAPLDPPPPAADKFNPHHDALGRFATGGGGAEGGVQPLAFRPRRGALGAGKKPAPSKSPEQATKPTPPNDGIQQYKKPKEGVSGKEGAKNIPSWVQGERPFVGEDGKAFAKRLLDQKYGEGNYKTGPSSEFNQLKKYGNRAFE